jgi:predicted enzyme related to lactoylglutathione lyase
VLPIRKGTASPQVIATLVTVLAVAACAAPDDEDRPMPTDEAVEADVAPPAIEAVNAFYYYDDVEAAWAFYTDVLGLETVADYGFAKILQVAPASLLTLVDAAEGMHTADEPKSVTLAIVTDEVEDWYAHLKARDVPMWAELSVQEGSAHDGFVAIDPEGYLLEFERFNEHDENDGLRPRLNAVGPLITSTSPARLGIRATVLWLYFDELAAAEAFYEELFDVDVLVDQGWAKVYPMSRTGYIGLVDASRGLHQATADKGVTMSFLTQDVRAWMARVRDLGIELRTPEIMMESDLVETFVAYDPTHYFMEWDTFLDKPGNERLIEAIR